MEVDEERGENRDWKLRSGLKQDSGAGARQSGGGSSGDDEGAKWGDEVARLGDTELVWSDDEYRPDSESEMER